MKIECPVCQATLIHRRTDDGFTSHSISKEEKVAVIADNSNGSDEVMCSVDASHEIPADLQEAVLELVWAFESKEYSA